MVQSLFQLALATCVKNAGLIDDVGSTPYHLVRPVLRRLNAKQLSAVEVNSPLVTPETDELWQALIEKDFPDRPLPSTNKRRLIADTSEKMPTKALYDQYVDEREQLRASSAQRLRNFNRKLQKEKSRNMIVPLKEIVREPVRRGISRTYLPMNRGASRPRTIIGKAMRDIQHRLPMFGGRVKHDPYRVFEQRKLEQQKSMRENSALEKEQRFSGQKRLQRHQLERWSVEPACTEMTKSPLASPNSSPAARKNLRSAPRPVGNDGQGLPELPRHGAKSRSAASIKEPSARIKLTSLATREQGAGRYSQTSANTARDFSSSSNSSPRALPTPSRNLSNSALYQYKRSEGTGRPELVERYDHSLPPPDGPPPTPSPRESVPQEASAARSTLEMTTPVMDIESRKRKAPSVFLPRKMPRAPRINVPKPKESESTEAVRIKPALRSSIFH